MSSGWVVDMVLGTILLWLVSRKFYLVTAPCHWVLRVSLGHKYTIHRLNIVRLFVQVLHFTMTFSLVPFYNLPTYMEIKIKSTDQILSHTCWCLIQLISRLVPVVWSVGLLETTQRSRTSLIIISRAGVGVRDTPPSIQSQLDFISWEHSSRYAWYMLL